MIEASAKEMKSLVDEAKLELKKAYDTQLALINRADRHCKHLFDVMDILYKNLPDEIII